MSNASNMIAGLEPREVRAEAEVRSARAERDVVVGFAGEVESIGLVERALVAVGRRIHEHDPVAGRDRLAGDLGVASSPGA